MTWIDLKIYVKWAFPGNCYISTTAFSWCGPLPSDIQGVFGERIKHHYPVGFGPTPEILEVSLDWAGEKPLWRKYE